MDGGGRAGVDGGGRYPDFAVIMLKPQIGWAVRVTRADGSFFWSDSGRGVATPTFAKADRKTAVRWRDALRAEKFNARVVRVHYAHPVEIPKA